MITLEILPFFYRFSERELKQLLGSIVILIDSREQSNNHIVQYFIDKGIVSKSMKLDCGDYGVMLPGCPELGVPRDVYFPVTVERKSGLDELAATFRERARFEHELARAQKLKFLLMVEDPNGYENIIRGRYQSQYDPKALLGSLKSFEARYGFSTVFIPRPSAGHYLYHHFYYFVRNILRGTLG